MTRTREILSMAPAGNGVVFTQELRADGEWQNRRARSATPEEISDHMTSPSEQTTGTSGSAGDHARLAPSDSARWTQCTASIAYENEHEDVLFLEAVGRVTRLVPFLKGFPEEWYDHEKVAVPLVIAIAKGKRTIESLDAAERKAIWKSDGSTYSREGSRAHDFAADILNGKKTLEDIPEEFRQPVSYYVEHCREMAAKGGLVYVEAKTPLFYDPNETGTTDHAVVSASRVTISDLKFGQGELVDPEGNSQLAIYAMSLVADIEDDGLIEFEPDAEVEIWIVQPRHHADEPRRSWKLLLADLREFCRDIHYAAIQVQQGRGLKFVASDKSCRWCSMRPRCAHRLAVAAEVFDNEEVCGPEILAAFEDLDKKEAKKMTPCERIESQAEKLGLPMPLTDEFLVKLVGARNAIETFLSDAWDHLSVRVLAGERIEGVFVTLGREGNRDWKDEEAADKLIAQKLKGDERYKKTLISPTQAAEKLDLKKQSTRFQNLFDGLVTRSPAKKVMALASDKRPAVEADVSAFDDLDAADIEDV